jgi:ATP adenylyltransferase
MRRSGHPTKTAESRANPPLLWAPWREAYMNAIRRKPQPCIFCYKSLSAASRRRRLILYENHLALVMLNRYPYTNGHLMVAPRRHCASPELLSTEERSMLDQLMIRALNRLRESMHPDGFNLGANLGRAAGAGFADHMHWHIVPRWVGDANFMPAVGSIHVLSRHLERSYEMLAPGFKAFETAITCETVVT